jgi:peptide/nickel transport system substrate-binding protein
MVLRVGLGQAADYLNPLVHQMSPSYSVYAAMYEYLCWVDRATGKPAPMLAKSWKVLDDHVTWEFELQEGVKFHNGEEFDAESVKVTFDYLIEESPSGVPGIRTKQMGLQRVEIVDKYKVRLITENPYVLVPGTLNDIFIYPAKQFSEVGPEAFGEDPVGTGKYRLKRWDKGVVTVLEKFEEHWGWGEPTLIDEIEFRGYPEDATRVAALRADEADIICALPPDDVAVIEAEGLKHQWTDIAKSELLLLVPKPDNPLMDKRVRQGISYGIDVDSIIQNVMLGFGHRLDGQLVRPGTTGYNPDLEPYRYDPDKARALLTEAGYSNGFSLDYNVTYGEGVKLKEQNEALAGQLAELGIETKMNVMEYSVWIDLLIKQGNPSPLTLLGLNYFNAFDLDTAASAFRSTDAKHMFTIAPEAMDQALERARAEFDPQKREIHLKEWSAIAREEAPCVFLYSAVDIFGVQPRVKDFVPTPDNRIWPGGIYIEE